MTVTGLPTGFPEGYVGVTLTNEEHMELVFEEAVDAEYLEASRIEWEEYFREPEPMDPEEIDQAWILRGRWY